MLAADPSLVFLLVILAVVVAIGSRLFSGNMDQDRIREYVKAQGGRLIDCNWSPFGRGWVGSKEERIYEITYVDRDGNTHRATCKTSMFSGVYFTEDKIVEQGRGATGAPGPESELERLRRENAELMRRLHNK